MGDFEPVRPLFTLCHDAEQMGQSLVQFTRDDYNKGFGPALISAQDDAQAISSFLSE